MVSQVARDHRAQQESARRRDEDLVASTHGERFLEGREVGDRQRGVELAARRIEVSQERLDVGHRRHRLALHHVDAVVGEHHGAAVGDVGDVGRELGESPRALVRPPAGVLVREALEHPAGRRVLERKIGVEKRGSRCAGGYSGKCRHAVSCSHDLKKSSKHLISESQAVSFGMRSYGHYCGLARSLDVVGDRWSLLIVRELLARGPLRYTDLQRGLPGIATNLLAARLAEMERSGIVVRETLPPPSAATVVRLTPRGEALEDVIAALGRWAAPLMEEVGGDEVRGHWYALPLRLYLRDTAPTRSPVSVELRMDDEPLVLEARGGRVATRIGEVPDPDTVVSGPPNVVMALLTRRLTLAQARSRGVSVTGDVRALQRFDRAG